MGANGSRRPEGSYPPPTTPSGTESWGGTGVFEIVDGASITCGAVLGISGTEDSLRASCRIGVIRPGKDSASASMLPKRKIHAHATLTQFVSEYSLGFFLIFKTGMVSRFRYFST